MIVGRNYDSIFTITRVILIVDTIHLLIFTSIKQIQERKQSI